jgi:hypothetical protein
MPMRSWFQILLVLVLALAACPAAMGADKPNAHNEICIVSTGETWSELAPCG